MIDLEYTMISHIKMLHFFHTVQKENEFLKQKWRCVTLQCAILHIYIYKVPSFKFILLPRTLHNWYLLWAGDNTSTSWWVTPSKYKWALVKVFYLIIWIWRVVLDRYVCRPTHYNHLCCNNFNIVFLNFVKKSFLHFSEPIHCMLYRTLLPKGRSFQPYITC